MSTLQKFLIPRHGNRSVMTGKTTLVLKKGEFFIETPDDGPGTGHSKIKIGDGVTPYPALPYAMGDTNTEVSSSLITFNTNSSTAASDALGAVVSGAQLKDMVAGIRQAISLLISAQKGFTTITDGTNYLRAESAADTINLTGGNNTTVSYDIKSKSISISSKDTTYSTGTNSTSGLTKLYTSTGTGTDGTMTQKAITDSLKTKLDGSSDGFIKNIAYSGHTVTVTKGDGTTSSFDTADNNTTYNVFQGTNGTAAGTPGLVPAPTANEANEYLKSNGEWADITGVKVTNAATADAALTDSAGNFINNTYIKDIAYSGHTVTVTKGNGGTTSFNTADTNTTYSAGTGLALNGTAFSINQNASTVAHAATADKASTATADSAGNNINDTYISDVAVNGRNITFTKGNGSTLGIATQDTNTTYSAGTGLSLNGTAFSINQNASTVAHAATADKASTATADSAGNNINSTYIKSVAVNGRNITFTKGNGTTLGITTQDTDTTYGTGTTATPGLTKLYTGTGTGIDGTMTQNAITNLVSTTKSNLQTIIGAINSFEIVILDSADDLPAKGVSHTVYFVPNDSGESENAYYEFIWLDSSSSYEQLGTTSADMSEYYQKTEVDNLVNTKSNSLIKGITYSGHTVTVTYGNGSTTSFNTADNNTTYSAGTGLSLSGTSFSINQSASTVAYATRSGNADSASKATSDSAGNNINNTYIKSVSVNGQVVTFTKGNGSTFSITTQDTNTNTTYSAGTGLALNGTAFSINQSASTVAYATKAGTADSASKATSDSDGQAISSTYIKDATVSGKTVTFTKGNGSTFAIATQDTNTTYSAGTGLTLSGTAFSINQSASTVAYATRAGNANSASNATADSSGQTINSTYIKAVSVSGRVVTFTKGNGSTFSITTQDTDTNTTYSAGTGLTLSGTSFSINQSASTVAYATRAGNASAATTDSSGQTINTTYIKNATVSGRNVIFTKGNGSTFSVATQDTNTTYSAGTGLSLSGTSFSINQSASTVAYATRAGNASSASNATNAGTATYAQRASYANYVGGAGTGTNIIQDNTCMDFGLET